MGTVMGTFFFPFLIVIIVLWTIAEENLKNASCKEFYCKRGSTSKQKKTTKSRYEAKCLHTWRRNFLRKEAVKMWITGSAVDDAYLIQESSISRRFRELSWICNCAVDDVDWEEFLGEWTTIEIITIMMNELGSNIVVRCLINDLLQSP